jgi:2-oxoglutarate ferredoxin oxidoreductase subunit alpha
LQEGAETLIVSYGVISRSAAVAIKEARARGTKISSLVLQTLYPVPKKAITSAMNGVKRVIVPEMNMGQYLLEVQLLAPDKVEVIGVNKMNTSLVSPGEIEQRGGLS